MWCETKRGKTLPPPSSPSSLRRRLIVAHTRKTATHTLEPFKQKAPDRNLKVGFQW